MHKFNTGGMVTIGMDISDRSCHLVALYQEDGEIAWEAKLTTRAPALQKFFSEVSASRIALEAGPHSAWISRLLSSLGHEVWVGNARKLRLIYENKRKSDRVECVQRRLVCSVGVSPTGVRVRSPVAWIALVEETKLMKPIDKAILRMASESPGRNASEPRGGLGKNLNRRPSPLHSGEGSMVCSNLTAAAGHSGGVVGAAR